MDRILHVNLDRVIKHTFLSLLDTKSLSIAERLLNSILHRILHRALNETLDSVIVGVAVQ